MVLWLTKTCPEETFVCRPIAAKGWHALTHAAEFPAKRALEPTASVRDVIALIVDLV
jgi:hypothetical protein